jgi:hypothetical protein
MLFRVLLRVARVRCGMRTHVERRQLLLVAASLIALTITGVACGSDSPRSGVASLAATSTTAPATTARTDGASSGGELVEYATCMRSHGVSNFPDSASFASSTDIRAAKGQMARISQSQSSSPTFEAAQRACAKYYRPTAPLPHVSPQEMQKLLAVSRCMRAHGVPSFPDPNPTTGELNTPAGLDKSAPQVLAALRACSALGRAAGLGPPST